LDNLLRQRKLANRALADCDSGRTFGLAGLVGQRG